MSAITSAESCLDAITFAVMTDASDTAIGDCAEVNETF